MTVGTSKGRTSEGPGTDKEIRAIYMKDFVLEFDATSVFG
jgi:hypothetical protein